MVTDGGTFANGGYGFRASAVDLGALQNLINEGLSRFSMNEVRRRWKVDMFHWMASAVRMWIQRCKEISFDVNGYGVHVSIETQDDRGYYHYEFDVFPGRDDGGAPDPSNH
jgi:predicted 2-oxoglutarate/Fe(II)-dependent dioxygenase YbiX